MSIKTKFLISENPAIDDIVFTMIPFPNNVVEDISEFLLKILI